MTTTFWSSNRRRIVVRLANPISCRRQIAASRAAASVWSLFICEMMWVDENTGWPLEKTIRPPYPSTVARSRRNRGSRLLSYSPPLM